MTDHPKYKPNMNPRDEIRERMTSRVRYEPPKGKFVDLFKRMDDRRNKSPFNDAKPSKSGDVSA